MGADFVTSARGFMFSLGCIQALQCDKNTCPTGVTTHNKSLQKGLDVKDKSFRVMHYAQNIQHEVGVIAHSCGVLEPREMNRSNCRIVQANGLSTPLDLIRPNVKPGSLLNNRKTT
jgi:glutamate synthase domain-containing protein 2